MSKWIGRILFLLLLGLVPVFLKEDYFLHLLIMSGVWAILCMGWVLLLRLGLFSLGQAAFLGIGGYTSVILCMRLSLSFWVALPLAGLATAFLAFLLGSVVLRLKGIYFAMVTFAFGEVVRLIYHNWASFLGGVSGISAIPRPEALLGISFSSKVPYYYLIVGLNLVSGLALYRIDHSRLGRISRSIGHNSDLAQSQGMNPKNYKVICFVVASFFAGLAGSFLAHYYTTIYPDAFGIWESILVQIKATVGGVQTVVLGPVVGAVVMTIVSELLRGYMAGLEPLFFGVFLILVIFFIPGGLASLLQRKWIPYPKRQRGQPLGRMEKGT